MLNVKLNLNKKIIFILGIIAFILIAIFLYIINNSDNYENYDEKFDDFLEISEKENILKNEEIINNEKKEDELIIIHIAGEVINPGIVKLNKKSRIIDAIEKAGGLTKNANLDRINLAYILSDGEKIYIPNIEDKEEKDVIINNLNPNETLIININTASIEEFEKLPGVGNAMAQRIVEYRNKNGKFLKIEDIKNVSGIGETKFNNIKKFLKIN